ncbi:MAG: hypothetical protein B6D39_12955 [Anaerolineae bacterium UTCFX2]|jgi:ferredoxin-type protein NapF|nr:4Fe-4S dicluster domain-containing protein [Anaerolineales bacterium]OQY87447.1 MAG: hypothetical protein B6D39_12955 [Anaerolineae bacterium UTCFX2]
MKARSSCCSTGLQEDRKIDEKQEGTGFLIMNNDATNKAGENSSEKPLSRKAFLGVAGGAAAMLGLGGIFKFIGKGDQMLRPPGALSEEHFRSLCIACGKCEDICPQKVIFPVHFEEDPGSVGTPRLDFGDNYCNLCMECTQICPTGALAPISQSEVRIGIAKVLETRCVVWLDRSCNRCVGQCPFRAIALDRQNRPYVKPELCVGCGICEKICALTAKKGFTKGIVVFPENSPELEQI